MALILRLNLLLFDGVSCAVWLVNRSSATAKSNLSQIGIADDGYVGRGGDVGVW